VVYNNNFQLLLLLSLNKNLQAAAACDDYLASSMVLGRPGMMCWPTPPPRPASCRN